MSDIESLTKNLMPNVMSDDSCRLACQESTLIHPTVDVLRFDEDKTHLISSTPPERKPRLFTPESLPEEISLMLKPGNDLELTGRHTAAEVRPLQAGLNPSVIILQREEKLRLSEEREKRANEERQRETRIKEELVKEEQSTAERIKKEHEKEERNRVELAKIDISNIIEKKLQRKEDSKEKRVVGVIRVTEEEINEEQKRKNCVVNEGSRTEEAVKIADVKEENTKEVYLKETLKNLSDSDRTAQKNSARENPINENKKEENENSEIKIIKSCLRETRKSEVEEENGRIKQEKKEEQLMINIEERKRLSVGEFIGKKGTMGAPPWRLIFPPLLCREHFPLRSIWWLSSSLVSKALHN